MKKEVETLKNTCFERIEMRLEEEKVEVYKKVDMMELNIKSLITETQVALSALQLD